MGAVPFKKKQIDSSFIHLDEKDYIKLLYW